MISLPTAPQPEGQAACTQHRVLMLMFANVAVTLNIDCHFPRSKSVGSHTRLPSFSSRFLYLAATI